MIQRCPKSILGEDLILKFFNVDYAVSLIHLIGVNFRLLIRRAGLEEEAIMVDLFWNEFVLTQFFTIHTPDCPSDILASINNKQRLNAGDLSKLMNEYNMNKSSLWLQPNSELKVAVEANLGQVT